MIRLLKFLITGDWHLCKWGEGARHDTTSVCGTKLTGIEYHVKCKICGKHKTFEA